jgi:hypothetical protein
MRDIPTADIALVLCLESKAQSQDKKLAALESTIATLQQMPTCGLTNQFVGMAASSPVRNDPVCCNLFPAAATAHTTLPDSKRLQMILNTPVTIHL